MRQLVIRFLSSDSAAAQLTVSFIVMGDYILSIHRGFNM